MPTGKGIPGCGNSVSKILLATSTAKSAYLNILITDRLKITARNIEILPVSPFLDAYKPNR